LKKGELVAFHSKGVWCWSGRTGSFWHSSKPSMIPPWFQQLNLENKLGNQSACRITTNQWEGLFWRIKNWSYAVERKTCTTWYMKVFRRLLNTSVHNYFIVYSAGESMKKLDDLM
jgi:hypothetical protein